MTTAIASATFPLKLALHTTCDNEWAETPDYAYLEISPVQARAIIYLMSLTQQFCGRAAKTGLVDPFYAVSLGLGERLPNFRLVRIPFGPDQEPNRDRPVVTLPEEFTAESVSETNEHRLECHRIEIGRGEVRFTALLKRGSDRFITTGMEETLLQMIANEYPTGLPEAVLASSLDRE